MENPIVYFLNETKYECQGYYPYILSITSPYAIYDFFRDRILITVVVDASEVEIKLSKYGFQGKFADGGWILFSKSGDIITTISKYFFGRVAYEFLSLNWLISEIVNQTKT